MNLSRTLAHAIANKNISSDKVVEVLTKYKLLSLLPLVVKALKDLEKKKTGEETIKIESPFPLNDNSINGIKKVIGVDKNHTFAINEKLLAGFKARFKGKLYDGSAERVVNELLINHRN